MGLLITGWSAQKRVFWLVPDVVSKLNCTPSPSGLLSEFYRESHLSELVLFRHTKASRHM